MAETDKRELIIEGAIRRFAHFGINKTTMAEIAEDLSVSKPSLYYYFPDKHTLIIAVAEKIIHEYIQDIHDSLKNSSNVTDAIIKIIDKRREFFEKYYMLHLGEEYSENYLKDPAFQEIIKEAKAKEVSIVAKLLDAGIEKGEFNACDSRHKAELLLEILMGLRVCMKLEKDIVPNSQSLDLLISKQKEATQIFLNGLKKY